MTLPIIVFLKIGSSGALWVSGILFAVAASTDYFDGFVARKYGSVTTLGKFLDQISDKILVTGLFIALFSAGVVNFWLLIVVVFRDIIVSGVRMIGASSGTVIAADMIGKVKTVIQFVFIAAAYFHLLLGFPAASAMSALQLVVGLITVASGLNYVMSHRAIMKRGGAD